MDEVNIAASKNSTAFCSREPGVAPVPSPLLWQPALRRETEGLLQLLRVITKSVLSDRLGVLCKDISSRDIRGQRLPQKKIGVYVYERGALPAVGLNLAERPPPRILIFE